MRRRAFIKSLATGLAMAEVLPAVGRELATQLKGLRADVAAAATPDAMWSRVRKEFMLEPGFIHLNCGSLGATPRLILDAVYEYMKELELNPVANEWGPLGSRMEGVRSLAAEFLGAETDEMVLTRNTTEGINTIASGLQLESGDEILTTDHEHAGGMIGWQYLARRYDARIVQIEMPAPVKSADQILELIEDNITPRTRVCSFSHVETITGLQMPLAAISRITRPKDILLVCDGAQAPGMLDVDVKALGVDAYASSSHKWMLAPKGSGLLYIRREVQSRIDSAFLFSGYRGYSASSGTRNVPHLIGHGLAMDFHNALGRDRVEARCRQLCVYLRQRLSAFPTLRLLTPTQPELSSGIVTFGLEAGSNGSIFSLLKGNGIRVKVVPGTYVVSGLIPWLKSRNHNALRFSTHVFNSEADIDRMVEVLAGELGPAKDG
ncbi:MAG: aminotransferase class V-fold PLP-dependent enzyme [Gemmatimonadetes bacterium]|jgi:isopenicillin-N epimerase|nr:aminotransferase class V-fold PLP-dependent enzyme [Gemmatimonadota bacterium]